MKEALTSLIEGIWREQAKEEVQDKLLLFQDDLKHVNMICISPLKFNRCDQENQPLKINFRTWSTRRLIFVF